METDRKLLTESFTGKSLEEVVPAFSAAGYKIRVVMAGMPAMLTENRDPGRVTIEVEGGKVSHISIG